MFAAAIKHFFPTWMIKIFPSSQRIAASEVRSSLRFFGLSISQSSFDHSDDGLPELAIGSKGAVVLLRWIHPSCFCLHTSSDFTFPMCADLQSFSLFGQLRTRLVFCGVFFLPPDHKANGYPRVFSRSVHFQIQANSDGGSYSVVQPKSNLDSKLCLLKSFGDYSRNLF